jgi:hypothetical protein
MWAAHPSQSRAVHTVNIHPSYVTFCYHQTLTATFVDTKIQINLVSAKITSCCNRVAKGTHGTEMFNLYWYGQMLQQISS